jgi:hypothetical protein
LQPEQREQVQMIRRLVQQKKVRFEWRLVKGMFRWFL